MQAIVEIVGVDDDGELADIANDHLKAIVRCNRYLMRRYPGKIPPLYESGVRFRVEPWAGMPTDAELAKLATIPGYRLKPPIEEWCCAPKLIRRGWGDCAQLCAWRVAELQEAGEHDASLRYYVRSSGAPGTENRRRWYHVEVRRGRAGDRAIEDPSRQLDF